MSRPRPPSALAPRARALLLVLTFTLAGVGGCSGDDPCHPVTRPADEPASLLDLAEPLPCTKARAGRVGVDQVDALPGGRQATSRAGDYKLYNCHIAFAIEGERLGDGYIHVPGMLVDADLATPRDDPYGAGLRRHVGRDTLRAVAPLADLGVPEPARVTVVNDGEDGTAAIVRAEGPSTAFPLIEWLTPDYPEPPLHFVVDYRLEPDAEAVAIDITALNGTDKALEFAPGVALQASLLLDGWVAERGFVGLQMGRPEIATAIGDEISYGLFSPDGLEIQLDLYAITVGYLIEDDQVLEPCESTSWTVYLAVVEDGVEGLRRVHRATLGLDGGAPLGGVVTDLAGAPAPGARVHAFALPDETAASVAFADATGAYELDLPPGDYHLYVTPPPSPLATATRRGHTGPVAVSVGADGATADLSVPALGTLQVDIEDEGGTPVGGKVQVLAQTSLPVIDARLGESALPRGLAGYAFTATGTATLDLLPGNYQVYVSRGFRAEPYAEEVTITEGTVTSVSALLPLVIDTTGWLSLDTHIHADLSMDGTTSVEARLLSIIGEGIDVAVESEHDMVADYSPVIYAMGLEGLVAGFGGVEISPAPTGHFNVYPLQPRADEPNMGAPLWWTGFDVPREIEALRVRNQGLVVQVNHPRSDDLGFFEFCGFDPATGEPTKNEELWTLDLDAIEISNGGADPERVAADYFSLLNLGVGITPVGTSDSHGLLRGEVGCAQTYLKTDATRESVSQTAFSHAMHAQRTVASMGLFVEAQIGNAGIGDLTGLSAASESGLHVRIQGASFVDLTEIRIIANGQEAHRRTVTPDDQVPDTAILFEGTFDLSPTVDTWYVVYARGSADLAPVCPGRRAFAMTAPIFIDADGDGEFTAPGPPG